MKHFKLHIEIEEEEDYDEDTITDNVLSRLKRMDKCGIWNFKELEIENIENGECTVTYLNNTTFV